MPTIIMYTTATCPYCQRAKLLLANKGINDVHEIRVDLDTTQRDIMMEKTGRRTVPQIYIDDFHVGGFDDLAALDHSGKLDPLLKKA